MATANLIAMLKLVESFRRKKHSETSVFSAIRALHPGFNNVVDTIYTSYILGIYDYACNLQY